MVVVVVVVLVVGGRGRPAAGRGVRVHTVVPQHQAEWFRREMGEAGRCWSLMTTMIEAHMAAGIDLPLQQNLLITQIGALVLQQACS